MYIVAIVKTLIINRYTQLLHRLSIRAMIASASALIVKFHPFSADVHECKIVVSAHDTALAKPQYNNQPRRTFYSCTPDNDSTQYKVHILSVYEVINRRPPKAGDATVNIISWGKEDRPIILILGSYEPVNWILNLPANLTISKVILVSTQLRVSCR